MDMIFEEVQRQARLLPLREKAILARILVEELDPETDGDVEKLWLAESKRRLEAYRNGDLEARPGHEVMARLFARLQ